MLDAFLFALSITAPIFAMIVIGVGLKRLRWIDDHFVQTGSKLVFNLCLPALLFVTISVAEPDATAKLQVIFLGAGVTLLGWLLFEVFAHYCVQPPRDRGVVVQGAFRGNMGIIGLAYCGAAYGDEGIAIASLYLAAITMLYNVVAVIALNRSLNREGGVAHQLKSMGTNPLILAIAAALVFSFFRIPVPGLVLETGGYLARLCLPLALICTGASLSWTAMKRDRRNTLYATVGKLAVMPLLAVLLAVSVDLEPLLTGVLVMMVTAPTATASYVMVRAMDGNAALAAGVIATTSLFSIVSVSLLLGTLRFFAVI